MYENLDLEDIHLQLHVHIEVNFLFQSDSESSWGEQSSTSIIEK